MKQKIDTKVKLIPMTIGRPEPSFPKSGKSWTSVPIPAISIALWMSIAVSELSSPQAPPTIRIGAMFATNIARICWRPKGMAFITGTLPSSV